VKIKNLIFLLLLLLPLHTSSIESINPNEEIIIDYMEYDKIYDNVDQMEREYVIFADDEETYETIKEENYILKSYDGLLALRVKSSFTDILVLKENYNIDIDHAFSYNQAFRLPEIQKSISSVDLDDYIDVQLMKVDKLWDMGYTGEGVTIGVYDSGVDFDHPALAGKKAFDYNNNIQDGIEYSITRSHGTFVSGMAAANGTNDDRPEIMGTAPGAKIGAINWGTHPAGYLVGDVLGGFEAAIQNNDTLRVINTSWGGSWTYFNRIVERLEKANILLVGSAGNSGPDLDTTGGPGNAIGSLSVGSTNQELKLSSYSSRGYGYDLTFKPDVIAPGEDVNSIHPGGQYVSGSGTSYSSPAVAGAAATLISAMNANNMSHNPGLIKAALMRGATDLGYGERNEGQGMINLLESWNYIQSLQKNSENLPLSVEITPKSGPADYIFNLPKEVEFNYSITLISSDPGNVELNLEGDLAEFGYLSDVDKDKQSQIITLNIDTKNINEGVYRGNITASVGNDIITSQWTIKVIEEPNYKGLIDVYHHSGDSINRVGVGSDTTGLVIKDAWLNGIWIEELNEPITEEILNEYDFFWMAEISGFPSDEPLEVSTGAVPSVDELNSIINYVENGGNIILNMDGKFKVTAISDVWESGTNLEVFNPFLEHFGVKCSEVPINIDYTPGLVSSISSTSVVLDVNTMTEDIFAIEHGGNYFEIIDQDKAEIMGHDRMDNEKITMANYISENGGRVFISSSTTFYSNGFYGDDIENQQNNQFMKNVLNWVTEEKRINKIDTIIENDKLIGTFQLLDGGDAGSGALVERLETNLVEGKSIEILDEGDGIFSFEAELSGDGLYEFVASYGDEYIKWVYLKDITGPEITPLEIENGSYISGESNLILQFMVEDKLSIISKANINLNFDGEQVDVKKFSYKDESKTLTYIINSQLLEEREEPYILKIMASDKQENLSEISFVIFVGEEPERPQITTLVTSSTITTETSNYLLPIIFSLFLLNSVFRRFRLRIN